MEHMDTDGGQCFNGRTEWGFVFFNPSEVEARTSPTFLSEHQLKISLLKLVTAAQPAL